MQSTPLRSPALALVVACCALESTALAQNAPAEPPRTETAPPAPSGAAPPATSTAAPTAPSTTAPTATPTATPAAAPQSPPVFVAMPIPTPTEPVDQRTDHEKILRKFGVSWLGISEIPIADATPVGTASQPGVEPNDHVVVRLVSAPVIGVRYWLNGLIAIEPGIGFSYTGGSTKSKLVGQEAEVDKKSTTAMMFHVGVPLALASSRHLALLVIPELNLGFARSRVQSLIKENGPPDAELSGLRLDAGARAGAEVHFGFLGMPELSLEGSIGFIYSRQTATAEVEQQRVTDTNTLLTTSSFNNPWDIFKGIGAVAARYYF